MGSGCIGIGAFTAAFAMENPGEQPGVFSFLLMGIGIVILVSCAWTIKKEILEPREKTE